MSPSRPYTENLDHPETSPTRKVSVRFRGRLRYDFLSVQYQFQIVDTGTATVADVMNAGHLLRQESAPIEDVARLMREKRVHRIIVERHRKVVGLISALDLITTLYAVPRQPARRTKKK